MGARTSVTALRSATGGSAVDVRAGVDVRVGMEGNMMVCVREKNERGGIFILREDLGSGSFRHLPLEPRCATARRHQ